MLILIYADCGRFAIYPEGSLYLIEFSTEIPKELGAKMKFGPAKVIGREVSLKEALRAADKVADRKMGSMSTLLYVSIRAVMRGTLTAAHGQPPPGRGLAPRSGYGPSNGMATDVQGRTVRPGRHDQGSGGRAHVSDRGSRPWPS